MTQRNLPGMQATIGDLQNAIRLRGEARKKVWSLMQELKKAREKERAEQASVDEFEAQLAEMTEEQQ